MKKKDRFYREARCPYCHRKLFEEYIYVGRIKMKCPNRECVTRKRGELIEIFYKSAKNLIKDRGLKFKGIKTKKGGKNNG